jgi:hypothetical protein
LPISFGGKPKEEDVVSLIAAKKYARAVEVLRAQLQRRGANPSIRMQLADVLILADKRKEAIALLLPLADQFATEGFAAKAVSVLKKVQKIDPGRRDVESRLAKLIEEKQREAVVPPASRPALGVEAAGPSEAEAGLPGDGPSLEIGFEIAPISAPAPTSPDASAAAVAVPLAAPPAPPELAPIPPAPTAAAPPPPVAVAPIAPPPPPAASPAPPAPPAAAAPTSLPAAVPGPPAEPAPPLEAVPGPAGEIEDYDLLYSADGDDDDEVPLEAEIVEETAAAAEPMSAGQFADELMGLVDSVFQEFPGASPSASLAPASGAPAQGRQIVVSPLFRDFSVDEMVAVIQGLKLLAFERGEVILKEGQPGGSLYMLTSGRVRAFRKSVASGKQDVLGDLKEGAFFGEVSILTGQPRMASIVALTRCELLELDRPTLDGITQSHPHVWDVLREFAQKRAG